MTLETYLRIVSDRLEENGVSLTVIQKTIERERAMVLGLNDTERASFLTEERLSFLVTSAKRSSLITTDHLIDEKSTIVSQDSHEESTLKVVSGSPPFFSASHTSVVPRKLLESDTATVVISHTAPKNESFISEEETAVPTGSLKKNRAKGLEKLLAESATVRISEKETMEFMTVISSDHTIISEDKTFVSHVKVSDQTGMTDITSQTLPLSNMILPQDDDALIPSFLNRARQKPPKTPTEPKTSFTDSLWDVKDSDLKNMHPGLLLAASSLILLPFALIISVIWLTIFSAGSVCFLLLIALPIILYIGICSASGGVLLYETYVLVSEISKLDTVTSLTLILLIASITVLLLSVLFLHRLIIPIYRFFLLSFKSFLKKNKLILKNLLRLSSRSLRRA